MRAGEAHPLPACIALFSATPAPGTTLPSRRLTHHPRLSTPGGSERAQWVCLSTDRRMEEHQANIKKSGSQEKFVCVCLCVCACEYMYKQVQTGMYICTSVCAGGAFVCACGWYWCVHMCVYWGVDGWVQKQFSIQRFNICTCCSELDLPKCFIYVTNSPRAMPNRGGEPGGGALAQGPADLPRHPCSGTLKSPTL